jgi:hypothetical protein
MLGISATQGGHHVAQKLINTTLPRKASREVGLPSKSVRSILGAFIVAVSTGDAFMIPVCKIPRWKKLATSVCSPVTYKKMKTRAITPHSIRFLFMLNVKT